jgi:hypothetical protein
MRTIIASLAVILQLYACSAEKKLHNRLLGTWNVASFNENSGNSQTNLTNIGTVSFMKDGRGTKELTFRVGGERTQNTPFSWVNTGTTVTIQSDASPFGKAWIVLQNNRKQQLWKSTNGRGGVQELTLKKQ